MKKLSRKGKIALLLTLPIWGAAFMIGWAMMNDEQRRYWKYRLLGE